MAEQQSSGKKRKVVGVYLTSAANISGANRNFVSLEAQWAKDLGVELEREGGMSVAIRWTQRHPQKGPIRCECLVQCTQIDFEATQA